MQKMNDYKQQQHVSLLVNAAATLENHPTLAPRLVTLTVTLHTRWGGEGGGGGGEKGRRGTACVCVCERVVALMRQKYAVMRHLESEPGAAGQGKGGGVKKIKQKEREKKKEEAEAW